ncbi:cellulose biosynthesis protein BcsG [Shigella flexneri]
MARASCGQTSHTNLYQPANNDCYLFDNLSKLGFTQHLMTRGITASSAVFSKKFAKMAACRLN